MTTLPPPASRLRLTDLLPLGTLGLRARRLRTAMSALGVAIGIAALVAVVGVTRSSQADLLAQIDRLGTNLLTVVNGQGFGSEPELPAYAARTIGRVDGVDRAAATAELEDARVYRNDRIPTYATGGLTVRIADDALLRTIEGTVRVGAFLNDVTVNYPVVVLGAAAADSLGIERLDDPTPILLGGRWFQVTGILEPLPLAPEIDHAALIGSPVAARLLRFDGHPTRIYVRADPDRTAMVAGLLAASVNPINPAEVRVDRPSDALAARAAVVTSNTALFLGLGAVALVVGGIGIANVMAIAILERRTEIGLRRALGATKRHIAGQFLTESLVLGIAGGAVGACIGAAVTAALARAQGWQTVIPITVLWGSVVLAAAVGALSGFYPAVRAARVPPTDALRSA
ncbi:MAG: ABC transporter permease [Egibacteraceae bacterium]